MTNAADFFKQEQLLKGVAEEAIELRELVRYAQHHIPEGAPDRHDFIIRATAVLGTEHAVSGDSRLAPQRGQTDANNRRNQTIDAGKPRGDEPASDTGASAPDV